MNVKNVFFKIFVVLGTISLFVSCEEDFGTLGTDIVGSVNFETELAQDFDIAAYSRNFENSVQTSGLPAGTLGFYEDPVYGTTTASVLSQLILSRTNPDFGENTVVDSVIFSLPYFSTPGSVDADGNTTYTLDSIFKNTGPMRLSAYRSNFFLNDLDPDTGFEEPQIYRANEIDNFPGLESDLLFQIEEFEPSSEEITLAVPTEADPEAIERISPRLRIDLNLPEDEEEAEARPWLENVSFDWQSAIIDREGTDVLLNGNNFNDYFRGVYLKAESLDGTGSFIILNSTLANIEVFYSFTGDDDSGEPGEASNDGVGSIVLNFGGIQAINYDTDYSSSPIGDPTFNANQDTENGEDKLYLKGGDGSIAIIELFGIDDDNDNGIPDEVENLPDDVDENTIPEQLESLRECGIIINEANLTFYVDQDALGATGSGDLEPERIFIYDFDNNRVLVDALIDTSAGNDGPVSQRTNHLGRLTRSDDGDSYRIRITQHINNIIQNDSTNVKLALSVSQNVLIQTTSRIQEEVEDQEEKRVPSSAVISPEGTILQGNQSMNEPQKLRLRIFYTITEEIDPNSPCAIALGL